MKIFYIAFLFFLSFCVVNAQLPDGTPAPPWTLQEFQTGESYTLQDYIDQGIPVMLDFSATWCSICWNYHNGHVFRDMYNEYGPNGTVEQDRVMVFFMEAFYGSNDACLLGDNPNCNSSTLGDWTAGEPYPFFNLQTETNLVDLYDIDGYPTLYIVSPQGTLFEVGPASKSTWESWVFDSFTLNIDSSSVTQVSCVGEVASIDINVSGGSGTLSYLWSNGATTQDISDIPAGTYSVTVTEQRGYSVTSQDFIINENSGVLSGEIVPIEIDCNGDADGVLIADVAGGTGSYTYLWSNGEMGNQIDGLSGGVYSVDVMDTNNCLLTMTYELVEPSEQGQENSSIAANCGLGNGQIMISGTGGFIPYTYSIGSQTNVTGVFDNLTPGTYTVEVEDFNNCIVEVDIVIEEIEAPVAIINNGELIDCSNPQIYIDGFGSTEGNDIAYAWNAPAGGQILEGQGTLEVLIEGGGTYELVVTDQVYGCSESFTINVEEDIVNPIANAGLSQTITCEITEVILDGSNSSEDENITYLWSTSDGNILNGENTNQATVNAAGTYELLVTNTTNGCSASSTVIVNQTADLPVADAGEEQSITCLVSSLILDGTASEMGNEIEYTWTTEDGFIVSGEEGLNPEINQPGSYLLEVNNTLTGCVSFSTVIVNDNTDKPKAIIDDAELLTCNLTEQNLTIEVDAVEVSYEWTSTDGNIVSGENSNMPLINEPGTYTVNYTDLVTGCNGIQTVEVSEFINTPLAQFILLTAGGVLVTENDSEGQNNNYLWDFGDGNVSTEENPEHEYEISGDYTVCLTVTNECAQSQSCIETSVVVGASLIFSNDLIGISCNGLCDAAWEIIPEADLEDITTVVTGSDGFSFTNVYEFSGLCSGEYMVEITNQVGEVSEVIVEIIEPSELMVQESEVLHIDCANNANGSIMINAVGGTGDLDITWNTNVVGNEINNLSGGTYEVTIVDENECSLNVDFTLEEPTEVEVDLEEITNIDDDNLLGAIDISVDGGTPPYFFLWSNGDQTEDVEELDFGQYTVIVTDANACIDEYGPYEIENLLAVEGLDFLEEMKVLPNPTDGQLNVNLEFTNFTKARISILNKLGQVVLSNQVEGSLINKEYDINRLAKGMYFVKLEVGNGVVIKKIIKM